MLFQDSREFGRKDVEEILGDEGFERFINDHSEEVDYDDVDHLVNKENEAKIKEILGTDDESEFEEAENWDEVKSALSGALSSAKESANHSEAYASIMKEIFDYLGVKNEVNKTWRWTVKGKYKGKDGKEYDKHVIQLSIPEKTYNELYLYTLRLERGDGEDPPINYSPPYYGWDGDITAKEDHGFNELLADRLSEIG